jgi:methylase of polypeptide subunit release factors
LVDKNVLIPRLETESLVRRVIQDTKNHSPDILIDVGTGSGIIPVSLGKNIVPSLRGTKQSSHLDISSISPTIYALDISE